GAAQSSSPGENRGTDQRQRASSRESAWQGPPPPAAILPVRRPSRGVRLILPPRPGAVPGSARFAVLFYRLDSQVFVGPQKPFTNGGCVAHQGSNRGVVLLAVLESADHGSVKTRAFGHVANAQAALLALPFQRLQRLLDVKVHPHRHDFVRVARAG